MRKLLITSPLIALIGMPLHTIPSAVALDVGVSAGSGGVSVGAGTRDGTRVGGSVRSGSGGRLSGGARAGNSRGSVSGGAKVGGGGVSAGVSAGTGGNRVSGGVSVGGGGATVGTGGSRISTGTATGGSRTSTGAATGGSRTGASQAPTSTTGGQKAATATASPSGTPSAPAKGKPGVSATTTTGGVVGQEIAAGPKASMSFRAAVRRIKLPGKLRPQRPPLRCAEQASDCLNAAMDGDRGAIKLAALPAVGGIPNQIVAVCRNTIVAGAMPYDPIRVDTVTAGKLAKQGDGGLVAPLFVRIVYARQGGYEVRQAKVKCSLDETGTVASLA